MTWCVCKASISQLSNAVGKESSYGIVVEWEQFVNAPVAVAAAKQFVVCHVRRFHPRTCTATLVMEPSKSLHYLCWKASVCQRISTSSISGDEPAGIPSTVMCVATASVWCSGHSPCYCICSSDSAACRKAVSLAVCSSRFTGLMFTLPPGHHFPARYIMLLISFTSTVVSTSWAIVWSLTQCSSSVW